MKNGKPIPRDQVPPGRSLCEFCTAKCCRYFALPIDPPNSPKEIDHIRWYLLHEDVSIFTEEDNWYLVVHRQCKHLTQDNRCGIYPQRPQICRDYSTDNCEYEDSATYDRYFETAEQFMEYVEALRGMRRGPVRTPQPPLLPVLETPA